MAPRPVAALLGRPAAAAAPLPARLHGATDAAARSARSASSARAGDDILVAEEDAATSAERDQRDDRRGAQPIHLQDTMRIIGKIPLFGNLTSAC